MAGIADGDGTTLLFGHTHNFAAREPPELAKQLHAFVQAHNVAYLGMADAVCPVAALLQSVRLSCSLDSTAAPFAFRFPWRNAGPSQLPSCRACGAAESSPAALNEL